MRLCSFGRTVGAVTLFLGVTVASISASNKPKLSPKASKITKVSIKSRGFSIEIFPKI
jgi:hypothetical protein